MSGKRTVLVVEDVDDIRRLISHLVAESGFDVCEARDSFEALKLIEENASVDIILSDLQMPDVNGLGLFATLRKAGFTLPFILMSGSLSVDKQQALEIGICDFIRKPFSANELNDSLTRASEIIDSKQIDLS